ncbi:MAG: imidazoleglycerol-phosphate dehydratase HisB [Thermoplasmata archaeon]
MKRKTREVEISVSLEEGVVDTGDEVLDHLLTSLSFYMEKELSVTASWDLRHHLWEDLGIILGEVLHDEIKDRNIMRFGSSVVPMDDALVLVSVDISRPYLNFDVDTAEPEKGFENTLVKEFLWALAKSFGVTIHVKQLNGTNGHHVIEAAVKALGMALKGAMSDSSRLESTKGVL